MEREYINRIKIAVFILLNLLTIECAVSQTVFWKSTPSWEFAEIFSDNMLRVKYSGKWGVVSFSGDQIIPCENSTITDICEERFLLLDENSKIISLRDSKNNIITLKDKKGKAYGGDLYADSAWPYFSEGLLAVRDNEGKWGFLNTLGMIVINTEWGKVYPFRYGLSAVQYKKNGNWCHIDKNGKHQRKPYDDIIGTSVRNYISSYTLIDNRPQSMVFVDDKVYMIDIEGNIRNDLFPTDGIRMPISYLIDNDSTISCSTNDIYLKFNSIGENLLVKNGNTEYNCVPKERPFKGHVLKCEGIEIGQEGRIKVDSLIISPQFHEIIPLSNNSLLIKNGLKWGLLGFDRTNALVKIVSDKSIDIRKNSEIIFKLSNRTEKLRAYTYNGLGEKIYFDIFEGEFKVPSQYLNNDNQITLGIEENGIILEPELFTFPPNTSDKSKFVVSLSSKNRKKGKDGKYKNYVKDNGFGYITISIKNVSNTSRPYSVFVDGSLVWKNVTEKVITYQKKYQISFGKFDDIQKTVRIEIQEEGSTKVPYKKPPITFTKEYESE